MPPFISPHGIKARKQHTLWLAVGGCIDGEGSHFFFFSPPIFHEIYHFFETHPCLSFSFSSFSLFLPLSSFPNRYVDNPGATDPGMIDSDALWCEHGGLAHSPDPFHPVYKVSLPHAHTTHTCTQFPLSSPLLPSLPGTEIFSRCYFNS